MSLDYEFAPIDVDIITHERVMEIDRRLRLAAFGLWTWGQCYAKLHRTDGRLRRAVVFSALASGEADAAKLAAELVRVGLWIATDDGWTIFNWSKKGPGRRPSTSSTERMRKLRKRRRDESHCDASDVTRVTGDVTDDRHSVTCASISNSYSPSSSVTLIRRSEDPPQSPRAIDGEPPEWFLGAIGTAEMTEGTIDEHGSRWRSYVASRSRKGWAMNHEDAVGWLCDVMRNERSKRTRGPASTRPQDIMQPEIEGSWKMPEHMP